MGQHSPCAPEPSVPIGGCRGVSVLHAICAGPPLLLLKSPFMGFRHPSSPPWPSTSLLHNQEILSLLPVQAWGFLPDEWPASLILHILDFLPFPSLIRFGRNHSIFFRLNGSSTHPHLLGSSHLFAQLVGTQIWPQGTTRKTSSPIPADDLKSKHRPFLEGVGFCSLIQLNRSRFMEAAYKQQIVNRGNLEICLLT